MSLMSRLELLPTCSEGLDRQNLNTEKDANVPRNWDTYESQLQMSITGSLQSLVKNRYARFFVHMSERGIPSSQIPITFFLPNS